MNCKPGDLAVVVRSIAGNEGLVLTCLRLATESEMRDGYYWRGLAPMWVTDRVSRNNIGGSDALMPDALLRPIRDQPGEDETLTWAEVPKPAVLAPKPQREYAR